MPHPGREPERSERGAQQAGSASPDPAWLGWQHRLRLHAARAEHAMASGDLPGAERETRLLAEEAERHGAASYAVIAHVFAARLDYVRGSDASCRAHVGAARELLRGCDVPLLGWRALASLGELSVDRGDWEGAAELYREAGALLERIAAGIEEPERRRSFQDALAVRHVLERAAP